MKIKEKKITANCKVFYQDLYGKRQSKYDFLWNNSIKTVKWEKLKPNKDNYFFSIKDFDSISSYEKGIKIDEIFINYTSGVTTAKDELFVNINYEFDKNNQKFLYRPFDIRNINYNIGLLDRSRINTFKHFIEGKKNIGLSFRRSTENSKFWQHVLVSEKIVDGNLFSARSYIFPLFIYQDKAKSKTKKEKTDDAYAAIGKAHNFSKEFIQFIISKYKNNYTPEQILGYIYSVLHSPTYRSKYLEFLKIDFPRVPFTDDENLFKELSDIGSELIDAHLLKNIPNEINCRFIGDSDNFKVEKVEYDKGKVWINKDRYFDIVPLDVWNFYIGGYQVLDKWLKERKKHEITLSGDDIQHFIHVVNVLGYTIKTMHKIDELTKEWI